MYTNGWKVDGMIPMIESDDNEKSKMQIYYLNVHREPQQNAYTTGRKRIRRIIVFSQYGDVELEERRI